MTLVYHMSGQMSVLSFRIRNLSIDDLQNELAIKLIFQDLAQTHRDILELSKNVNSVFGLLLLNELLIFTILVGLTIYTTIENYDITGAEDVFSSFSYGMSVLMLVYISCSAGQYLFNESMNVSEAYYDCLWYDMPASCKKQLIICMIGTSKPISLSAAGFYDYTLPLFISITKTAGGYISLLQTMTEKQNE
ncbi:odorant receptor 67a-like [Venturia canescens]|uniref:odorant receptor 67a-like n=1 Tax=Venturia canescens TaxID=32260 RepID=UPI001C9C45AF|nr:odorant receptor 67a-like [Venturia canescens]